MTGTTPDVPATRRIGPLDVCVATRAQALAAVCAAVASGGSRIFGFCNAHTVNMARARTDFREAVRGAILFNDGIGVDIASRALHGTRFPDNLNGTDLTPQILAALPAGTPVYLIGSPPGVAAAAADILAGQFPVLRFVGSRDGFFASGEEATIAAEIRASGARLVLAGMGHPRQELWASRNRAATGAVILCIGAFLDFTAGRVRRAPQWVRTMRIEWLFRLALEPRRMVGRYLIGNAAFLLGVARQKMARLTRR